MSIRQEKVSYMLQRIPAGAFQGGIYIPAPVRIPTPGAQWPYKIEMGMVRIEGAKIPAPTIQKFQAGLWTPRDRSIDKIEKFYNRFQYARLRAAGFNTEEARRLSRRDSVLVQSRMEQRLTVAATIAREKNVPIEFILQKISESEMRSDDWDEYIRRKGYKK